MKAFIRYWLPAILYAGIIFFISSIPGSEFPKSPLLPDYFLHTLEYLPFGFLICRAIKTTKSNISIQRAIISSILLAFIYGISDEFHQSFIPGRYVSLLDLLCDVVGATIGIKIAI